MNSILWLWDNPSVLWPAAYTWLYVIAWRAGVSDFWRSLFLAIGVVVFMKWILELRKSQSAINSSYLEAQRAFDAMKLKADKKALVVPTDSGLTWVNSPLLLDGLKSVAHALKRELPPHENDPVPREEKF